MIEGAPLIKLEPAKAETVTAILAVIDSKLDNPEAVRRDSDRGNFVIEDKGQDGHCRNTRLELNKYPDGVFMRFIESFNEATRRSKPSVLITDYDIVDGQMVLLLSPITDIGPLAQARLSRLKSEGLPPPLSYEIDDPEEEAFTASEKLAQIVLESVQNMKIYIE